MALQRQIVSAPFAQGIDTKSDPLQIPGGKNLVLQNASFQKTKELRKRFGYAPIPRAITGGGTIAAAQALGVLGEELVMGDGSYLYSLTPQINSWRNAGAYIPALLTTQAVNTSTDMTPRNLDSAYDPATGLKCFIWQDGVTQVYYSIVDAVTGEVAASGSAVTTGIGIVENKICVIGGFFVIMYSVALNNDLRFVKINTTTLDVTGPVTVAPDLDGTAPNFDMVSFNSRVYFSYNSTTGGAGITTAYMDVTLSGAVTFIRDHTKAASGTITVWGDTAFNCWVAWSDAIGVYSLAYNPALSGAVVAFQTLSAQAGINQITGVFLSGLRSRVFYCARVDSTNDTDFIWTRLDGVIDPEVVFQRDASLASKAFSYAGNIHLVVYTIGDDAGSPDSHVSQATYFVVSYQIATGLTVITGKVAPGLAPRSNPQRTMLPETPAVAPGIYQFPFGTQIPQKWSVASATPTAGQIYFFYGAQLDLTVTPQTAEIAGSLHLTGAQLWLYDGLTTTEHGFHLTPAIRSVTPTAGAGPFPNATKYIYIATYSWSDAQGQTHTSGPSAPFTYLTAATASKLTVVVKTLRLTNKTNVQVNIYRTSTVTGDALWYGVGTAANSKTVDTVSIDDTATADGAAASTQLYTNSGEVSNGSAPACASVVTYKSRLLVVPSDNPYSWWFSKPVLPASGATVATPAEFSPFFIQNVDQKGGPLTAVLALDDKIILGKSTPNGGALFYVTGDGPAITGASNDFSTPQIITSPVGILAANGTVLMPGGIMFQAENGAGIWLLDRGLSVSYIGAPVEYANSLTVRWATLIPEYNQVRFVLSNGTLVVYDYFVGQWSTYTNFPALAGVLFEGNYAFLQTDGTVQHEDPALFTDNGAAILRTLTTGWLDLQALNGFQRVRRLQILGTYYSPHSITIGIAYDYDGTIRQTDTINVTAAGLYEFLIHLAQQKCEAMQVTIADASGSGEGARWSGLTFEVGAKKGLHKLPPTAAYG